MTSMSRCPFFLLLLTGLFLQMPSYAYWESFPEYQSLDELETPTIEGPDSVNAEYQSDLLVYGAPWAFESNWLLHDLAIHGSTGSISGRKFATLNRAKIRVSPVEKFEFRFTYFDESDFERTAVHHVFDFIYKPWKWIGLDLYAEPFSDKRNDDLGLALLLFPLHDSRHEIRVFQTWVDLVRNIRNDREDRFVEGSLPLSRGVVGRVLMPDPNLSLPADFIEYALRNESPTQVQFPTSGYLYQYWKWLVSFRWNKTLGQNLQLGSSLHWDRKFESKQNLATSLITEQVQTDRVFLSSEVFIPRFFETNLEFSAGLQFAYRNWMSTGSNQAKSDLLPYVQFGIPAFGHGKSQDRIGAMYNVDWHNSQGGSESNHRLSLSYQVRFDQAGEIRIIASYDIDELFRFGQVNWDGGCIQLRFAM